MDTLVIGAGVIGLSIGAALARRGANVIVAEQSDQIGSGISSRNSEVIHGGMYYPQGSLRARCCVDGRRRLYSYCHTRGVRHAKLGKFIVATSHAEEVKLAAIHAQGKENGVENLEMLSGSTAMAMEPALSCFAALWSPMTGIIDSHSLMLALQGEIEDASGSIAFLTEVRRLRRARDKWTVEFGPPGAPSKSDTYEFDAVVNAAGLRAQTVARTIEGLPETFIPKQRLAKGSYFSFKGRPVFSRLIYPAPVDGGLGTHVTFDLDMRMRFGPDVEWIETENYDVDPERVQLFYSSIRRYFPSLPDDSLEPAFAGIRPKLTGPGEPAADFMVSGPEQHGQARLVNLFGIESPGLTSCLTLADIAAGLLC